MDDEEEDEKGPSRRSKKPKNQSSSAAAGSAAPSSEKIEKPESNDKTEKGEKPRQPKVKAAPAATGPTKESKLKVRIDTSLANHQKTLQQLTELTGEAVWKSLIRGTELDRRLTKATAALGDLQKIRATDKIEKAQEDRATQLEDSMAAASKQASALKEACRLLRGSEPATLATEIHQGSELWAHVEVCGEKLISQPNILMDMIAFSARKLVDAPGLQVSKKALKKTGWVRV